MGLEPTTLCLGRTLVGPQASRYLADGRVISLPDCAALPMVIIGNRRRFKDLAPALPLVTTRGSLPPTIGTVLRGDHRSALRAMSFRSRARSSGAGFGNSKSPAYNCTLSRNALRCVLTRRSA